MMIQGFDKAVATMNVGDVIDVHLMPDPGCGYTVQTDVQLWMRDRLVEAIDIVPFGYADTLRGQAEAEENEAFE